MTPLSVRSRTVPFSVPFESTAPSPRRRSWFAAHHSESITIVVSVSLGFALTLSRTSCCAVLSASLMAVRSLTGLVTRAPDRSIPSSRLLFWKSASLGSVIGLPGRDSSTDRCGLSLPSVGTWNSGTWWRATTGTEMSVLPPLSLDGSVMVTFNCPPRSISRIGPLYLIFFSTLVVLVSPEPWLCSERYPGPRWKPPRKRWRLGAPLRRERKPNINEANCAPAVWILVPSPAPCPGVAVISPSLTDRSEWTAVTGSLSGVAVRAISNSRDATRTVEVSGGLPGTEMRW